MFGFIHDIEWMRAYTKKIREEFVVQTLRGTIREFIAKSSAVPNQDLTRLPFASACMMRM